MLFELHFMILISLSLGAMGATMYRLRGMDENDVPVIFKPRIVRRLLCCILIAVGAIVAGAYIDLSHPHLFGFDEWAGYAAMIAWVSLLSFTGIILGHGSYFPRESSETNEDNESLSFITKFIQSPMKRKARVIGMALTGFAITVPVALLTPDINIWYAAVGALKPIGYLFGWQLTKSSNEFIPEWFPRGTEFGEWWWGFWMVAPIVFA